MAQKTGKVIVPTEPASRAMTITGFTFKSYDKKAGVLQFEIKNQDGSPTDLIDATVRLFMYIYQGEEKKEFPIFDNQIITESYMQGIVKYRIPDMLLSYEGKVDANVYIDFPDGSHTDNLAFTFNIEKSVIDDNVQLNGEYYFKDFQQLLDGVKQEATDAVNEALAKVEVVSENVSSAQNDLTILEDRIDQTNQQIGDLGKLKKMYSNSIDFGDYDYSGRPNLAPNLDFSKLSAHYAQLVPPPASTKDGGSYFAIQGNGTSEINVYIPNVARLEKGATYIAYVPMKVSGDFSLSFDRVSLHPYNVYTLDPSPSMQRQGLIRPDETCREKWKTYQTVFTVPSNFPDGDYAPHAQVWLRYAFTGTLYIGYDIKIEKVNSTSDQATPFQPNLLVEPYNMCREYPNENMVLNNDPATSSAYLVKNYKIKSLVKGKKYTVTLKGTKPSAQTWRPFFSIEGGSDWGFGDLKPVEGLPDTWTYTFAATADSKTSGAYMSVYQVPNTSVGQCKIDWCKLEEGDTRTPNISQFKYFGEGLKDSNDPNDYSWDFTPEYAEKGLNDTVSLTEPQSVEGLKNFEDGLQVRGKEVATVPEDTGWVNLTAINGHSWNKQGQIRRIGKLVMFRGSLKGSTLSTQDFCTIPEGFRPSNPTDNYEYQFLLPPQSSNTLDNGGMAYIRPNGVCGLPSFRGTANLFLAPIQYYID